MNRTAETTAALALTALALTACGGGSGTAEVAPATSAAPVAPSESFASPPLCADLFEVGQPINFARAKDGCTDPDGNIYGANFFRCNDGTHLWQIDARSGAAEGYGFDDKPYTAITDAADDPRYGAAYDACHA